MPPGPDDPDPEEGPVLAPEELDISDDDHVTQIDEGRFVVSPHERVEEESTTSASVADSSGDQSTDQELNAQTVHRWLSEDIGGASSRYGFDVTAKFTSTVEHKRLVSNDVVTIFESLMLWYAGQIDTSTPVEEILGIMLMESNVPIKYPPQYLRDMLEATDLGPEDSIADLVDVVTEEEGLQF